MSITTRNGDDGTTTLIFGQRVPKCHPRIEALGCVDELNAALGLAKATAVLPTGASPPDAAALAAELEAIQRDLVQLMGELAADDPQRYIESRFGHLEPEALARLDRGIARLENGNLRFDGWATPGGTMLAATLDLARTSARRAERQIVALRQEGQPVRDLLLQYINRVSDLLWLLARQAEQ